MEILLVFLALIFGAIFTIPAWGYSARWKHYPSGAFLGLAMLGALLVVAGVI